MRMLFMGTAPFACPTLRSLLASTHQVAAVVTQPDRPSGRGQKATPGAVKRVALEHQIPIVQPVSLRRPEVLDMLAAYQPEVIIVAAYGNILPVNVLQLPYYGCINLHASLLPKYRGAAPINWTLMHGETITGYTIIQMDAHVDTGPILEQASQPILPEDDAVSLGERLAEAGAQGMVRVLANLAHGRLTPEPQSEQGASYAPKLTRELGFLNWQQPAVVLHNLVRGLVPWPGTTTLWRSTAVKIWRTTVCAQASVAAPGTITALLPEGLCVACGEQQLLIHEVQLANRRRMSAQAFVRGYRVQLGDRFDHYCSTPESPPDGFTDPTYS
ncbi:MAG: methionyl-tRNA formyltransferase [Candidatus Tectimicrobiota bacterium]